MAIRMRAIVIAIITMMTSTTTMAITAMTMITTITGEIVVIIVVMIAKIITMRVIAIVRAGVAKMLSLRSLFLLALLFCAPLLGKARYDHFMLGVGGFNMLRDHRTWQFQWEYRWDVGFYQLRPLASLMGTEKGTIYLCGGVGWDIFMGKRLVLTPSFAPGLYFRGSGKSLHFPVEFRSAIELAYVFGNKGRLGAQFYHISNASMGHKNPGAESLIFFYAVPIGRSLR